MHPPQSRQRLAPPLVALALACCLASACGSASESDQPTARPAASSSAPSSSAPSRSSASSQAVRPTVAAERPGVAECLENHPATTISPEELAAWEVSGPAETGVIDTDEGPVVRFKGTIESPDSVALLSPDAYAEDLIVRFRIRFGKPKSIAVTLLSASTAGTGELLVMPDEHPDWLFWGHPTDARAQSYLFSIHTAFHQRDALLRKRPGRGRLHATPDTVSEEGRWYTLEMGKMGDRVWMDRDGEPFLEATDPDPLPGGRVGFLFTAEGNAGFQIADVSVVECS
jgi:hypothetical protein